MAPNLGATCSRDSECGSPLVCRFGSCRSECAANRDCPVGARCLLAGGLGSCSLDADERCESGGHACPSGLMCLGDRCVNTCTRAGDCPPDATCSPAVGAGVSFCFATGRDDAGPGDDAGGPIDAGPNVDASSPANCGPSGCGGATSLCVGDAFACVVRDGDNHVLCWGRDTDGQLGNGGSSTTPHPYTNCTSGDPCSPRAVEVLSDVDGLPITARAVACAANAACAAIGSTVWCWGSNVNGEVGRDTSMPIAARAMAVTLPTFPGSVNAFGAMGSAFCVQSDITSGYVVCWGLDVDDVFGISRTGAVVLPTHATQWDAQRLALGDGHMCALASSGALACDGSHRDGELGPGYVMAAPSGRATITFPGALGQPSAIVAGAHFSAVILDDQVWTWGTNAVGSLGRSTAGSCLDGPCDPVSAVVGLPETPTRIWAQGFDNMVCAQSAAHTWCWGVTDRFGALFAGSVPDAPTSVPALDGAMMIAGGARSLCALDGGGAVLCFGANDAGELGDGHATSASVTLSDAPVHVCIADDCP